MSMETTNRVEPAFSAEHLVELVEANRCGPDIDVEMAERIINLAKQRTINRSDSPVDDVRKDHLVFTDWDQFCRDTLGSDGSDVPNRFALVVPHWQASSGRDAWLCKDAVAVQQGWLESGDGRMSQLEPVDQTDTSFHEETGEFWAPKEYVAMVTFGDDLVRESPSAADVM